MPGAIREAHLLDKLQGAPPGLPRRTSGEEGRQLDVLLSCECHWFRGAWLTECR
jgi:hypothetical protein